MPDIQASAEVAQLIGAENLRELSTGAFRFYECAGCHRLGDTADPTRVVVHRHPNAVAVLMAHARCADSEIIEVPEPFVSSQDMRMRAITQVLTYPSGRGRRPLLLLERRVETTVLNHMGDRIGGTVADLLDQGLALMRAADAMPDLAAGWRLDRSDPGNVRVLGLTGEIAAGEGCSPPSDWAQLVDPVGACVFLVGTIGLYAVPEADLTGDQVHQMLDDAARAGRLAGGLVIGVDSDLTRLSPAECAAELDRRIGRFWSGQA
jgi:hypothetical protein